MTNQIFKLLLIDDDVLVAKTLRLILPAHWQLTHHTRFQAGVTHAYHVAFVDIHLSGNLKRRDGLDVILSLSKQGSAPEIFAISGDLNREIMEEALEAGASRFLAKPLKKEELLAMLAKVESLNLLQSPHLGFDAGLPAFLGNGSAYLKVQKEIAAARGYQGAILLEGETGTGKEVVARLLNLQEEAPRPFVAINMAALPDNLFESELFGHVKGAFTGAEQHRVGLIEAAHGGDVFFDEIEAFPLNQQAKLLRFLESGEIRPVGSSETRTVNVRCIFASNQDLQKLVREEKFREDLLWRIRGRHIMIPPLRVRKEDIPLLTEHFLKLVRPPVSKTLGPDAVEVLSSYEWPGNIRELKRVCEQLALVAPLPIIRSVDVEGLIQSQGNNGRDKLDLSLGLDENLRRFEKHIFEIALREIKDPGEIQALLKISRSTYYKKLSDLHLSEEIG